MPPANPSGLAAIRRGGTVSELLLLYACATRAPTQLKPIAQEVGVTLQAISHLARRLRRQGMLTIEQGRYRPTVRGVAWLHETLRGLREDVEARLERLHVIRTAWAIAAEDLPAGARVTLEMREGELTARAGPSGPSRGRTATAAVRGEAVEIRELEGIVPLPVVPVVIRTVARGDLARPDFPRAVRPLWTDRPGLLAAVGLETAVALRRAGAPPFERFAVAAIAREASPVGVPVTVLCLEEELPRLLAEFAEGTPPPLDVRPLYGPSGRRRARSARTSARRSSTPSTSIAPRARAES
ncbi:MAG: hypothetical protein QXG65_03950 [Thermoplasmata archaeon]